MYRKILVPLDGSEIGEAALPYVEELLGSLAPGKKVEVVLVRVVAEPTHIVVDAGAIGQAVVVPYNKSELELLREEAVAYLNRVAERLRKNRWVVVTPMLRVGGNPADEILTASDEIGVNLIAISTHGRSGFSRWALGSVADKILTAGNTPVLMVRAGGKPKKTAEKKAKKK